MVFSLFLVIHLAAFDTYFSIKNLVHFSMKEINDIEPSTSRDANRSINDNNNRKRRASGTHETDLSAKRFIVHEDEDSVFKLLDFTDEVLLDILQNCDSTTLYALSK